MTKRRGVIFSFLMVTDGSVIPSVRIAQYVSRVTGFPVTDYKTFLQTWRPGDTLLLVNGAYAFCRILQQLGEAVKTANRIIWIQNDYTIIPPRDDGDAQSPFRRAFVERNEQGLPGMDFWTTCEDYAGATRDSRYVNWNALTWNPERAVSDEVYDDLFYYGSFRDGSGTKSRKIYFDRYFAYSGDEISVTISSPGKSDQPNDKFIKRYPNCAHVGKMSWPIEPALRRYGAGLYLEDRRSHREFHSPANRFYEMLGARLPIIFQPECATTFRKAGLPLQEDWICSSRIQVKNFMKRREQVGKDQWNYFTKLKKFREELDHQTNVAVGTLS